MDIPLIIAFLFIIIVILYSIRVLKNIFVAMGLLILFVLFIYLIVGLYVYSDSISLLDEFDNSDKLVLCSEDERMVFGFEKIYKDTGFQVKPVSKTEIDRLNINFRPYENGASRLGEYADNRGDDRLYLIDISLFEELNLSNTTHFIDAYNQLNGEEGLLFIIKGYNAKKIIIYPETGALKMTRYLPEFILETIFKDIKDVQ